MKVFNKTTLVNALGFTKRAIDFAAPGLIAGSAVIVAASPVIGGLVLINLSTVLWFALFMLAFGVAATLLERLLSQALHDQVMGMFDATETPKTAS